MRPVILYRGIDFEKEEQEAAAEHFFCTSLRPQLQKDDLIIGRYSLWPFYRDQEKEFEYIGAKLINTYQQHLFVANMMEYVEALKELTPKTWYRLQDIPEEGPFILKGSTNSKKFEWSKLMFAKNKAGAIHIHGLLQEDGLIGNQEIYVRQYIPLVTYATGLGGIPITKEFRFFVAYGEVLCGAYYWASHSADLENVPSVKEVPTEFLEECIKRIGSGVNFYALDVAQTQEGKWIVIELNDGQHSGLSDNDPKQLYANLKKAIERNTQ
jgi:ATP-grasp domain, R2K clade family 3